MPSAEPDATGPSAPPAASPRPGPSWKRWAVAGAVVLAIAGFYALDLHRYLSWVYLKGNVETLKGQVRQHLVLATVLFFLIYATVTALSLPVAAPLSLIAGALFERRWLGTTVVLLAATLGATLAFLTSRYLFRDLVQRRFGARLEPINRGVERDGAYYLFTLRLVPAFPFFLINLAMGLTRMRTWTFFWVSLVGMLPGTFLYVNAGTELSGIQEPKDALSPSVIASLALLGIAPLLLRKALQWRKRTDS